KSVCEAELTKARQIARKAERGARVDELRTQLLDGHFPEVMDKGVDAWRTSQKLRSMAKDAFRTLEKKISRKLLIEKGIRADGRNADQIRPIDMEVGLFPRTHGSALFQRGETQSLV